MIGTKAELDLAQQVCAGTSPPSRMIVCATAPGLEEPQVSLADGVYETLHERIFWRGTPETDVLRLPLDIPVVTRPMRFPTQRSAAAESGEAALLKAVQHVQASQRTSLVMELGRAREAEPLDHALGAALEAGDVDAAYAHAVLLRRKSGLTEVYEQMSRHLAALASSWAAGTGSVLVEHRATRTVARLTERLSAQTATLTRSGTVILALPEGDQHTVVLSVLAHLLRDAGRAVEIVDALPTAELLELAARPGTTAVLLSVHTPMPGAVLRALLRDLRAAGPELLLAVGGPGLPTAPTATIGADLIGDDLGALLTALDAIDCVLTGREAQVLSAVADGLTNSEIASLLGVAPATVKSHMDKIFVKTRTVHRAAAVARALRRGWIS